MARPHNQSQLQHDHLWHACGNLFFCNFRVLYSPSLSRRHPNPCGSLLRAAIHPDHDSRPDGSWDQSPFGRAAGFIWRGVHLLGISAVELAVRGNLLRRVSSALVVSEESRLGRNSSSCICRGRNHGAGPFSLGGVARLRSYPDGGHSLPGLAAGMFAGGAKQPADSVGLVMGDLEMARDGVGGVLGMLGAQFQIPNLLYANDALVWDSGFFLD